MHRIRTIIWALQGLVTAWVYLRRGNPARLKLPPARTFRNLEAPGLDRTVHWVDGMTRKVVWGRRHGCFYRSLGRAFALRRMGLPVMLNLGLRNLDGVATVKGHCWLSLHGAPYHEASDPLDMYPFFLGELSNGVLCWVQAGNDATNRVCRKPASFRGAPGTGRH